MILQKLAGGVVVPANASAESEFNNYYELRNATWMVLTPAVTA